MDLDVIDSLIEKAHKVMGKEKSAKLSTKKRKSLPDSSFCGPGRSFPVNDCAHYTAALRLLNRSKFSSSTKAKIRACVNRKGKAMGCGGAKKAKSAFEEAGGVLEEIITLDIFKETVKLVEASIEKPGMELDFTNHKCV